MVSDTLTRGRGRRVFPGAGPPVAEPVAPDYEAVHRFLREHGAAAPDADLDDMVQDVCLRAVEGRQRFKRASSGERFVRAIAGNVLRNHGRSKCRPGARRVALLNDIAAPATDLARLDEPASLLREALANLTARQREAIALVYFGGLSPREAAHAARCSVKTMYERTEVALARLRSKLSICRRCVLDHPEERGTCPAEQKKIICRKFLLSQYL